MTTRWIDVADTSQFVQSQITPSGALEVVLDDHVIAIFHHNDRWFAIDGICSHQGGPLAQGTVCDQCVTCPWHGWQYELETGIQTVNRQPLQKTFPVRERDGRIEIQWPC